MPGESERVKHLRKFHARFRILYKLVYQYKPKCMLCWRTAQWGMSSRRVRGIHLLLCSQHACEEMFSNKDLYITAQNYPAWDPEEIKER